MGDPTNIIFRSLWEKRVMHWLDTNTSIVQWSSEELIIPYFDPSSNKRRRYFPDFLIKAKTTEGTIVTMVIEVKPKAQTVEPIKKKRITRQYVTEVMTWGTNQAKWDAATAFCKERGWQFKVLTEDQIYGKKKTK